MPVLRQSFFRQGRFDNPFAKSYRRQAFQVSHLSQGIFPPISSHTPRAWNARRVEVVSMSALFPWLYRQSPTTFSFQECPFRTCTDARCLSHGWLNEMTFIILIRSNPAKKGHSLTQTRLKTLPICKAARKSYDENIGGCLDDRCLSIWLKW